MQIVNKWSGFISTQFYKMLKHPGTCNRVEMGVTAKGIMHNCTIKIFNNADSPREPVCIARIFGKDDIRIMKFMAAENSSTKWRIIYTLPFYITDYPFCRHPRFPAKNPAHFIRFIGL